MGDDIGGGKPFDGGDDFDSSSGGEDIFEVSVNQLVADYTGANKDPYFTALSAMRRLCKGKLDDCEDPRLVQSYEGYIYGDALGLLEK